MIDAPALIDALKNAWKHPNAGKLRNWHETRPMGPRHDRMPLENPYWEIVRWLPWENSYYNEWLPEPFLELTFRPEMAQKLRRMGAGRESLVSEYAWSIPTPYDIYWMKDCLAGDGLVESGAGSGYWAWQLRQAGVDVVAYDPNIPGSHKYANQAHSEVLLHDHTCVEQHPDRALFLCWPRYGEPDAFNALSLYRGDMLFYAGEQDAGCTGDEDFFKMLSDEWVYQETAPLHTTFSGIHCDLELYTRRGPGRK